jgi:hypothetical protein
MKSNKRAPGTAMPSLGLSGDVRGTRLKLVNGLFRTKESPTSLPAAAKLYDSRAAWDNSFMQGGSAEGRWGTGKKPRRSITKKVSCRPGRPKAGGELVRNLGGA